MFLLEGHTRPAMKQAKGITSGSGVYSCIVVFNKLTGKILAARDHVLQESVVYVSTLQLSAIN